MPAEAAGIPVQRGPPEDKESYKGRLNELWEEMNSEGVSSTVASNDTQSGDRCAGAAETAREAALRRLSKEVAGRLLNDAGGKNMSEDAIIASDANNMDDVAAC